MIILEKSLSVSLSLSPYSLSISFCLKPSAYFPYWFRYSKAFIDVKLYVEGIAPHFTFHAIAVMKFCVAAETSGTKFKLESCITV